MIPDLSFENAVAWFVQVAIIALAGAVLPSLLRIRHPKSQLLYYHAVLVLCCVLPFIQPLQHSLIVMSGTITRVAAPASGGFSWVSVLGSVIALGIVAKLCWLVVGLFQLKRFRRAAIPVHPIPEAVRRARLLTGADALFCVSKDVTGPATLGYIDPVVLLPVSFLSLDEEAQLSIACHELLHVRRRDWLVTMMEEIAGALFWFHPAMRWLLGQAKLSREQLVDSEVVRMTAPAPYIEALLSMAVAAKGKWALPAAPFFTEGHLVHRMRLLLANSRRSVLRLIVSYASAAAVLSVAGWCVSICFPLSGESHVLVAPLPSTMLGAEVQSGTRREPRRRPQEFNVRVPAPPPVATDTPVTEAPRDVFFFVHLEGEQSAEEGTVTASLPIPVSPLRFARPQGPGPFPNIVAQGIRIIRPGDRPTPEEIEKFVNAFPERSVVEVTRTPEGIVERVMVRARRLANEKDNLPIGPSDSPAGIPAGATSTAGANTANGVD